MNNKKIVPFDLKKKYKKYDELPSEDYCEVDGIVAPLYVSVYVDKYGNTIGKTASGIEVLITEN